MKLSTSIMLALVLALSICATSTVEQIWRADRGPSAVRNKRHVVQKRATFEEVLGDMHTQHSEILNENLTASQYPLEYPLTNGSCRELFVNASQKTSGYYRIYPGGQNEFTVFCDMNTNVINRTGDGWTVILRRLDSGLPSFNKTWKEYRNGFGSLNDSFWLGLKKINQLVSHNLTNCSNTTHQLYVGMERFHPTNPYKSVFYNIFTIGDESTNFTLNVNTTNGVSSYNTGLSFSAAVVADALAPHSGLQFSTYDQDNDNHSTVHCANTHGGGWWYRSCIHGHLTGMFYSTGYDPENNGIFWQGLTTDNESLKQAVMAIRPVCND